MRVSWPRPTIRTRLTGAAAGVTLLMLVVASFAITSIQRHALTNGVDEAIRQRADNLAPVNPGTRSLPGEGDREDSFLQLLDGDGRVQASSSNAADMPAVRVTA